MFQSELELLEDPTPDMWILAAPLVWQDPVFGRLEVPVGFRTDLASIPRPFRNLPFLDPAGLSRRPAAMHDWLYAWRVPGKDVADSFLRAALLAEGASRATASTFYYGVHWFGRWSWASDAGKLEASDFDTLAHFSAWTAATHP